MASITAVRERVGAELLRRVAGPEAHRHRQRIHGTPGPRWFAPGTPITRVHSDASMFVGGLRAVLFQTLHPAAMTAVAEHSGYRGDMWGRLARTSRFIAVTTFGTADDAERAVRAVRAIHDRVSGTLPDGTPYAASDPHLLAWVHATEVDSFLRAHRTYGARPLSGAEADEYVAQTAGVARRLGVRHPPTDRADLDDVLESFRAELRVTDHAREAVSHLVWHPDLPLSARPAYGALTAAAAGMLPAWSRAELGLPRLPVADEAVTRAMGTLATRTIRWALPPAPVRRNPIGGAV